MKNTKTSIVSITGTGRIFLACNPEFDFKTDPCRILKERPDDTEAHASALAEYQKKSRDNGRTPVQWSSAPNGGFTGPNVKPWMSVNPDFVTINAEDEVKDLNSPYHFWGKVLGLRKKYLDIFVYGDWVLIDQPNQEVFAYTRQYEDDKALVLCNWTETSIVWDAASNEIDGVKAVLLDNYDTTEAVQHFTGGKWSLRPYEAAVFLV